jgi:acetyl-CoA carboxylase carboxyl transferase subunit beta
MDRHPNQVMRRPNAARPLAAPGPKLRPVAPAGTVECRGCGRRFGEARFEKHLRVCPDCGRHAVVPAMTRVAHLGDAGSIDVVHMEISDRDPLGFNDGVPYPSRVAEARERTRIDETFVVARADVATMPVVLACMDFGFLGGSLGSAAGEQFARACDLAVAEKRSLVAVCTSGGARMQEGIVSLAQMARCSAGVVGVARAGLPYVSVLADPCFGGVTASFAVQADVILAEPHARIGFAGGRVIEQATYDRLPEGFQTSEFLLAHGMVDAVVPRSALRDTVARLLVAFSGRR